MTADLPEFVLSNLDDGATGVVVAEDNEYTAIAALVAAYPALPDHPGQMAQAVNRFARNNGFDVIIDPAAYETAARARIAAEDPDAPFVQGVYRLRDFGIPDFPAIHAPALQGGALIFFAEQALTGLPYRVTVGRDGENPVYEPLPMNPLPANTAPEDPDSPKPVAVVPDEDDAPLDQPELTPDPPEAATDHRYGQQDDSPASDADDDTDQEDPDEPGISLPDLEGDVATD